jgi:cyclohexa-1,5-dienecarbonyl-CoA hydratase
MTRTKSSFMQIDVQDGIATIALDRPPVNVIHIPLLEEMASAFDRLAEDSEVRVLVLAAKGKMFSAGVDVADHTADKVGRMIPLFNRVCSSLADFPVPTIAAVHGHALGGGCELVLCCDLAVMAASAKLGQPEIKLAVFAPIAALRLPSLVGYRAAAELMFGGEALDASAALGWGLVNAVLPSQELDAWVSEKSAAFAKLSRPAMVIQKRALKLGFSNWASNLPEVEDMYLNELMNTADAAEGLDAFMEKREPRWSHR